MGVLCPGCMDQAESKGSLVSCEAGCDGQPIGIGGFATSSSGSLGRTISSFISWNKSSCVDVWGMLFSSVDALGNQEEKRCIDEIGCCHCYCWWWPIRKVKKSDLWKKRIIWSGQRLVGTRLYEGISLLVRISTSWSEKQNWRKRDFVVIAPFHCAHVFKSIL